jgi:3-hydroxyisobutyrate dehydrogenase-like beta-hydroxyacid dehydrogenase
MAAEESTMPRDVSRLCFIGFGEAGQAMAAGLAEAGVSDIVAWDVLLADAKGQGIRAAGERIGYGYSKRCSIANAEIVDSSPSP